MGPNAAFDLLNPFNQMGLVPDAGPAAARTSSKAGLSMVSPVSGDGHPAPWNPDNPLFWFAGLLALTFGFIGASTSVKLGPFKGSLSAGDPK